MMDELLSETRALGGFPQMRAVLERTLQVCNQQMLKLLPLDEYQKLQTQRVALMAGLTIIDTLEGV